MNENQHNNVYFFRINPKTLILIRAQQDIKLKQELSLSLGKSLSTINRLIRKNDVNGYLTTVSSMIVLGSFLGLSYVDLIVSCPKENL